LLSFFWLYGPDKEVMSKSILVVDDDPDIREILRDRLESDGYTTGTATSGKEAIAALAAAHFDGMLLDIMMPEIDGLEVLRQTRESYPDLPVVMMTASKKASMIAQAVVDGAKEVLLKPFDPHRLKQTVTKWFGPA
jgi:two-component system response regulator MprA